MLNWTDFIPSGLKLKENLAKFPGSLPLAPTSYQTIAQMSGMKLLKFDLPENVTLTSQYPLFIIPSLINRYYVLDLLPEKSFIEYFLRQGIQVYLLDWGMPQDEDNFLSLDQLIDHRIDYFVDKTLQDYGCDKTHLIGHCLGGTLSSIYTPLHQDKIASLMLLTAPVDFNHGGKIGVWATLPQFNVQNLVKAHGNMPWWMMQSSFQMLKPMLWWHKTERLLKEQNNSEFQKNFWALEIWSHDNISFPGKCYETLITEFYRKNAIVNGVLKIHAEGVDLKKITSPVLNLAAEDDHIVLFKSTIQPYHLNKETQYDCFSVKGGHIGALLGSKAQKNIWPKIRDWILKQEDSESMH